MARGKLVNKRIGKDANAQGRLGDTDSSILGALLNSVTAHSTGSFAGFQAERGLYRLEFAAAPSNMNGQRVANPWELSGIFSSGLVGRSLIDDSGCLVVVSFDNIDNCKIGLSYFRGVTNGVTVNSSPAAKADGNGNVDFQTSNPNNLSYIDFKVSAGSTQLFIVSLNPTVFTARVPAGPKFHGSMIASSLIKDEGGDDYTCNYSLANTAVDGGPGFSYARCKVTSLDS